MKHGSYEEYRYRGFGRLEARVGAIYRKTGLLRLLHLRLLRRAFRG